MSFVEGQALLQIFEELSPNEEVTDENIEKSSPLKKGSRDKKVRSSAEEVVIIDLDELEVPFPSI